MANRYIPDDDIANSADKSEVPETLYVDLQGDQRTRPIMCATEFSGGGSAHKKKSTSFQITSVTVQGSRLSNDGGDDSADDLDESHTEDISSDILDCSKTTDLDNDPLSSADSNANLEDIALPISSKQFIPVKVITSDSDSLDTSSVHVGLHVGFPVVNSVIDTGVTLMTSTTTSLPVINSQVPIVNSLAEHLQHRFKVVKVVSTEPFKRGRWTCMDFTDPPAIHSEQKPEIGEGNETLHVAGTFNIVPTDNPPSVAQFYEIPVNQQSVSMAQQQPPTQSVYGILLPVANNTSVTKVQNVGVQVLPAETSNQAGPIPTPPISTQSQATVATISTSNAPLMQSQLSQAIPNNSQSLAAAQQSQGGFIPLVQPNQGIQVHQPAPGIPVSQPSQAVPTPQPVHVLSTTINQPGVTVNHPTQVMPVNVIQNTQHLPINANTQQGIQFTQQSQALSVSQQQQLLTTSQPTQDLPTTQQSQVLSAINQSQGVLASQINPGIGVPSLHVLSNAQSLQGLAKQSLSIPQQGQGISLSQSNQSVPVPQPNQGTPAPQPCQGIPATQPSQGIPVPQSGQGISIPQQGQGIPAAQPSQGIPISQHCQGLPVQPNQGLSVSQSNNIPPSTQSTGNQGLPGNLVLPVQAISSNVQQVIPISQTSQVLPITNTVQGIPAPNSNQVLSAHLQEISNTHPSLAIGLPVHPSSVTQSSQGVAVSQPNPSLQSNLGIAQIAPVISVTQANLVISTQRISLNQTSQGLPATQPTSSLTSTTQPVVQPVLAVDPTPIISLPNPSVGATNKSVNIDICVPSQSINAPQQLVSVSETSSAAINVTNPSPLLDIIPETLGTRNLQEGEEAERVETDQVLGEQSNDARRLLPEGDRSGMEEALQEACASSSTNTVAIDNKIEQAMDLVKSHLMFAVREEVDVLKEKITELLDRISQLEHENDILKANATPEMLNQLSSESPQGLPSASGGAPTTQLQSQAPEHP